MLDTLVQIAIWISIVSVAFTAAWHLISFRLERRRSIARVQGWFARAPGIPDADRARLIAEVPQRFKESLARQRNEAKRQKADRPSKDEIWKEMWEAHMRYCGEGELVDELSGQWSTERELEALLQRRHAGRSART